jgi:hypothetical protein
MSYSVDDYDEKHGEGYNPRAIEVVAKFLEPKKGQVGLRNLKLLYQEMLLDERLYVGVLPPDITRSRKEARNHAGERRREMIKQANIQHLRFCDLYLKELRIVPLSVSFYDDRSNMHYTISLTSLGDIAELMMSGTYKGLKIPEISATFNDREITIDFYPRDQRFGITNSALNIGNKSEEGTLEDILGRLRSTTISDQLRFK